jgi:hypothetical protein
MIDAIAFQVHQFAARRIRPNFDALNPSAELRLHV